MYARHFGLNQAPFSIAPDPRFLFMSERHREALAHLLYGLQSGGGFVVLTGEIGAGKTTVCRAFLEQVPAHCQVAYIFNPQLNPEELLQTVCQEFGISPPPATRKGCVDALNRHLLEAFAQGRQCVLVVDEAQNLASDVLEQLRLLTNLETDERKLLQIILIGQPELRTLLARPELEQLAQRVIARYHLGPLDAPDTARYVAHRLAVAGLPGALPFSRGALRLLHQQTQGVPRRINLLADRALLGAYAGGLAHADSAVLRRAAAEVFDRPSRWRQRLPLALGLACGAAAMAGLAWLGLGLQRVPPPLAPAEAAASAAAAPEARSASAASAALPSGPPAEAPFALAAAQPPTQPDAAEPLLRELARRWVSPEPARLCDGSTAAALSCLRSSRLTLATVATLDRPGLVTLEIGGSPPWPALLLQLDAERATLRYGGTQHVLTRAAFGAAWRGDFTSFWRAPPGGLPAAPEWLDTALAQALPGVRGSLPARVAAFQRAQGLVADGQAGALTLMQLNRALGIDEPRLSATPGP